MIKYNEEYTRDNPSEEYKNLLNEYKDMHKSSSEMFNGRSLVRFAKPIRQLIRNYNCESLLDYGCGKGTLYTDNYNKVADSKSINKPLQEYWNIQKFTLYDPGEEKHSKLPKGLYDIVINTDVLEHVPENDLVWVIREIFNYSNQIVFLNICCLPALKHFKDGRNVHVSLFSVEEWLQLIARITENYPYLTVYVYADDKDAEDNYQTNSFKIIPRPTIIPLKMVEQKKDSTKHKLGIQRWD